MTTTHAPTFTRGETPYWTYPCGCKASALALEHCPTHAHAPAMLDGYRQFIQTGDLQTLIDTARAILRAVEG